jgi:hypothetical protein
MSTPPTALSLVEGLEWLSNNTAPHFLCADPTTTTTTTTTSSSSHRAHPTSRQARRESVLV